jgi:hypothetical protein
MGRPSLGTTRQWLGSGRRPLAVAGSSRLNGNGKAGREPRFSCAQVSLTPRIFLAPRLIAYTI